VEGGVRGGIGVKDESEGGEGVVGAVLRAKPELVITDKEIHEGGEAPVDDPSHHLGCMYSPRFSYRMVKCHNDGKILKTGLQVLEVRANKLKLTGIV